MSQETKIRKFYERTIKLQAEMFNAGMVEAENQGELLMAAFIIKGAVEHLTPVIVKFDKKAEANHG